MDDSVPLIPYNLFNNLYRYEDVRQTLNEILYDYSQQRTSSSPVCSPSSSEDLAADNLRENHKQNTMVSQDSVANQGENYSQNATVSQDLVANQGENYRQNATVSQDLVANQGENYRQNPTSSVEFVVHNPTSSISFRGPVFNHEMDIVMYTNFLKLVEELKGREFYSTVERIYSRPELFLDAAFTRRGSNLIQKLIKKLKRSPDHASKITWILSSRFWDLMVNYTAKEVIEACFLCFPLGPNKILFYCTIHYVQDLAIHRVGCKSLQKCIKTISGEQKTMLLDHIAEISYSLSRNEYGNYVVQEVLKLQEFRSTYGILCRLRGHFIELSKDQEASNVVDRCVELSVYGLLFVVTEILESPRASCMLAKDRFGNYVIQKALTGLHRTLDSRIIDVVGKLVGSLEPYVQELNQSVGGKNVVNILKFTRQQLKILSLPINGKAA